MRELQRPEDKSWWGQVASRGWKRSGGASPPPSEGTGPEVSWSASHEQPLRILTCSTMRESIWMVLSTWLLIICYSSNRDPKHVPLVPVTSKRSQLGFSTCVRTLPSSRGALPPHNSEEAETLLLPDRWYTQLGGGSQRANLSSYYLYFYYNFDWISIKTTTQNVFTKVISLCLNIQKIRNYFLTKNSFHSFSTNFQCSEAQGLIFFTK